jgi:carbon-monoxide dehydrogenase small subunit
MAKKRSIRLKVNGTFYEASVEPRKLLSDLLREDLELTGTHVGCEHGICGVCTILFNGKLVRSCLTLAVQADGAEILTIEGLAREGKLHPIQEAFYENHGAQCGFCTPGQVLSAYWLLKNNSSPTDEEIKEHMSGVLCRCTGYYHILKSVKSAAQKMVGEPGPKT